MIDNRSPPLPLIRRRRIAVTAEQLEVIGMTSDEAFKAVMPEGAKQVGGTVLENSTFRATFSHESFDPLPKGAAIPWQQADMDIASHGLAPHVKQSTNSQGKKTMKTYNSINAFITNSLWLLTAEALDAIRGVVDARAAGFQLDADTADKMIAANKKNRTARVSRSVAV